MIIKGRSPTMRHVSRTHRVALDWLFDRINLDPKIQIKYIDTKNQLADILTKGNLSLDEWNHLLNLFNISHFNSTACTAAVAKRSQQDSGEERVTAKSRPMMNLVARTPSLVLSSTSVSTGRDITEVKIHGVQLLKRTDRGDLIKAQIYLMLLIIITMSNSWKASLQQVSYSKLDDDRAWSSQEWKTETTTYDRLGRPDKTSWRMVRKVRPDSEEILLGGTVQSVRNEEVLCDRSGRPDDINSQEVARPQIFVMGNDGTELELSAESRSFVNRVNDQVRKRQKRISSVKGNREEHLFVLLNVYGCNNGISNFHGEEFPKQS